MYKSKLQELCQKKAWTLPEYNITKEGQDHNPRFEATVIVNGKSFQPRNPARSSKEAQNDAAQLAFLHFTAPPLPDPGSSNEIANFDSNIATLRILQLERQEANQDCEILISKDNEKFKDMRHLYKNLLQNFAQKRNLSRPVYSCEFEGPPHASRFRCKVTINENTYESLEFFPTIKEAEHAAAKIALSCLSPDAIEEEDSTLYKNLLQELAQKEGCPLPVYNTTRSGEAHASTFVSIVEVKGEVFTGQAAKTKKQAEFLAAKVAYMKLKGFNRTVISHHISVSFPQPEVTTDWQSRSSSSNLYDHPLPEDDLSSPTSPSTHSTTTDSVEDSIKQPVETSDISCNRVVVRPRVPDMKFPSGSTVLPISDSHWVAVKLGPQPSL
ncbi:double-stranded RNA-binding protein 1-like isoform X3 [Durio zibethinus]|uniref:Double-stranded RNA-binding protein 1-like isoform X3 n=1 Tax=Durio zibethinus TaxID=66656 RepID=A0A6P5YT61_DURZI|nr:double-stranded RNA-binding protein 1-like isoform X3 [Durio zibethinus]